MEERREKQRVIYQIEAKYQPLGQPLWHWGKIQNISAKGVCLKASQLNIPAGITLNLIFFLGDGESKQSLEAVGRVVWSRKEETSRQFLMGINLVAMAANIRSNFSLWLENIQNRWP